MMERTKAPDAQGNHLLSLIEARFPSAATDRGVGVSVNQVNLGRLVLILLDLAEDPDRIS
jgi:hypothetical protein